MRINHNISALNTYNKGQSNHKSIVNSTQKLSSGLRINQAADDVAGLAISEGMRAQILGLEQAERNIHDGISLIQIADGGLEAIDSHLHRARELAVQASNDTLTERDRQIIQKEIDQIKANIDLIANETEFNGIKLLNGANPNPIVNNIPGPAYNFADVLLTPPVGVNGNFQFHTNQGYPTTGLDDNKRLVYGNGSTSHPSVRIDGMNFPLSSTSITPTTESGGVYTTIFNVTSKNVQVAQSTRIVKDKFEISYSIENKDSVDHTMGFQFHMDVMLGDDDSAPFVINDIPIDTQTVYMGASIPDSFIVYNQSTGSGGNAEFQGGGILKGAGILLEPDKFAIGQYSAVSSWDFNSNTGTVGDSGYSIWWNERTISAGGSLSVNTFYGQSIPPTIADPLTSHLSPYDILYQVGPNSDNTYKVQLSDVRTEKLDISTATLETRENAQIMLSKMDVAINKVTSERTKFGAYQNALEHIYNNASNYKNNLTDSESQIRDTDITKEITKLTNKKIVLELSQTMLSQANQITQSELQFLK